MRATAKLVSTASREQERGELTEDARDDARHSEPTRRDGEPLVERPRVFVEERHGDESDNGTERCAHGEPIISTCSSDDLQDEKR